MFLKISNYLKASSTRFPGAQSASPRTPSAYLRSVAAAVQGSVSAEADGKCPGCSVVCNALGKCQFVVDISKNLEEKNTFRSSPTFNDLSQNSLFCPPQHPSPACGMWCVPSGWLTFLSPLVKIPCLLKHSFPGSHQRIRRFPLLLKIQNLSHFFFPK